MPYYRLYHFSRSRGIDRIEEIRAADDLKAVAIARQRERDSDVELWQAGRKLLRLERPAFGSAQTKGQDALNSAAG